MRNVEIFKIDLTDRNSVGCVLALLKGIAPECVLILIQLIVTGRWVEGSSVDIRRIQNAMHKLLMAVYILIYPGWRSL